MRLAIDALLAAAALTVLGMLPAVLVSVQALPALLMPARVRCWWRRGGQFWLIAIGPRRRPPLGSRLSYAVLRADRFRCVHCHARWGPQIDHIRPWSCGGLSALWNLMVLCGPCNRAKSDYWPRRNGTVYLGHGRPAFAAAILASERRARRNPLRWVRASLALAGL